MIATIPDGRRAEAEIEIDSGQREAWLALELDRGRGLRGVVFLNGWPLAGARVRVASLGGRPLAHTLSGPRGGLEIRGLDEERVQLDLTTREGDLRRSRTVDLGSSLPVEIDIHTGTLVGRVKDAGSGAGLAGASVTVEPLADSTWLATPSPGAGPDEGFGPRRLPHGCHLVTVWAPGFSPASTEVGIEGGRREELVVPLAAALAEGS